MPRRKHESEQENQGLQRDDHASGCTIEEIAEVSADKTCQRPECNGHHDQNEDQIDDGESGHESPFGFGELSGKAKWW